MDCEYTEETIRWHNLGHAPCFSASSYLAPAVIGGPYQGVYPVAYDNYEPETIQRPEYAFVAQCKNCHREFHLDPDSPIPPAFCGLGMTHGCGSSDWHVFKRLIEVEIEDKYQDDCVYGGDDSLQVEKFCRPVGMVELPPMNEKEASTFREKWGQVIRHVRQNPCIPGGT